MYLLWAYVTALGFSFWKELQSVWWSFFDFLSEATSWIAMFLSQDPVLWKFPCFRCKADFFLPLKAPGLLSAKYLQAGSTEHFWGELWKQLFLTYTENLHLYFITEFRMYPPAGDPKCLGEENEPFDMQWSLVTDAVSLCVPPARDL